MRILSGIQPTGRFHWGNYFGAIKQYIELQEQHDGAHYSEVLLNSSTHNKLDWNEVLRLHPQAVRGS